MGRPRLVGQRPNWRKSHELLVSPDATYICCDPLLRNEERLMPAPTELDIVKALETVRDPASQKSVIAAGLIEGLALRGGHVSFAIEVDPARGAAAEPLRKACEDAVNRVPGVLSVSAVLTAHRERKPQSPGRGPAPAPHAHRHAEPTPD